MTYESWKISLLNDARTQGFEQQIMQMSDYVLEHFWETNWPPIIESLLGFSRKPVQSERIAA